MKSERLVLTMPRDELAALDAYCVHKRRETGQQVFRTEIIREAVTRLVHPAPDAPATRREDPTT